MPLTKRELKLCAQAPLIGIWHPQHLLSYYSLILDRKVTQAEVDEIVRDWNRRFETTPGPTYGDL